MRLGQDFLVTARRLSRANPSRPRQADLKRAISTAYYALFHTLAHESADRFIGTGNNASKQAWVQVYRALDHRFAKDAGQRAKKLGFPKEIVNFADTFRDLQEERHRADYDPSARFTRGDALIAVANAEQAMADLRNAPKQDRAAFAALVLFKRR